jgi:hypothetical protein
VSLAAAAARHLMLDASETANSPLSTLIMTVNSLLFFFPRAANLLGPFFVTAPIIEFVGDRRVTAADPLRILRCGYCRFDSARF